VDIFDLKSRIQSSYFDYQKLMSLLKESTHARRVIGALISKGLIIRIKKGLYVWGPKWEKKLLSKEIMANLIYGPSYVSLEYALSYYHLIPERVETVTSVTTKRKKKFDTPMGAFTYDVLHSNNFPMGVYLKKFDDKNSFMIASPEKSFLDTIALRLNSSDLSVLEMKQVLEQDLRIDMNEFKKLDRKKMLELAKNYRQSSIKVFSNYLKANDHE